MFLPFVTLMAAAGENGFNGYDYEESKRDARSLTGFCSRGQKKAG
jgi:hypothetical protein